MPFLLGVSEPDKNYSNGLKPRGSVERRKEGVIHLFLTNVGRQEVAYLAPEQVMVWGECFGHQGVFPGKCCWGMSEEGSLPRARVQQLDFQLGRKMLSREEPRSLSDRNSTASFKKHILGDLS